MPVRNVAGWPIYQAYIGSSANPGLRDFAIAALMVEGQHVHDTVSFDINPASRQVLEQLIQMQLLAKLIHAGARLHQVGCNGCIGMGQAPASGRISLRTVPRNFPGRSGTPEDQVYLCSPETATASALTGVITDPRSLGKSSPRFVAPTQACLNTAMLVPPLPSAEASTIELVKGPNIVPLLPFAPLADNIMGPVLLKLGDNISTDEILPAGEHVLPLRSNLPAISQFVFAPVDTTYAARALQHQHTGSLIVAGKNYGQGSSREHAALAPRYLGVHAVLARGFARIHQRNLINFGILPLTFVSPEDEQRISQGDVLCLPHVRDTIRAGKQVEVRNETKQEVYMVTHPLNEQQVKMILAGGLLNLFRERSRTVPPSATP